MGINKELDGQYDGLVVCDHCFNIKGKGTVLTGTVIGGRFESGDKILLPEHHLDR